MLDEEERGTGRKEGRGGRIDGEKIETRKKDLREGRSDKESEVMKLKEQGPYSQRCVLMLMK